MRGPTVWAADRALESASGGPVGALVMYGGVLVLSASGAAVAISRYRAGIAVWRTPLAPRSHSCLLGWRGLLILTAGILLSAR